VKQFLLRTFIYCI